MKNSTRLPLKKALKIGVKRDLAFGLGPPTDKTNSADYLESPLDYLLYTHMAKLGVVTI